MTSHIHLALRSINDQKPELLIGDLKRFISKSSQVVMPYNNTIEGAENYVYSSATDYAGQKGIVDDVMVFRSFDL